MNHFNLFYNLKEHFFVRTSFKREFFFFFRALSHPAHDVIMTSFWRLLNVRTLYQRWNNVLKTLCSVYWVIYPIQKLNPFYRAVYSVKLHACPNNLNPKTLEILGLQALVSCIIVCFFGGEGGFVISNNVWWMANSLRLGL